MLFYYSINHFEAKWLTHYLANTEVTNLYKFYTAHSIDPTSGRATFLKNTWLYRNYIDPDQRYNNFPREEPSGKSP